MSQLVLGPNPIRQESLDVLTAHKESLGYRRGFFFQMCTVTQSVMHGCGQARLPILLQSSSCGLTIKLAGHGASKMNHFFSPIIADWEKYMQPCWKRQLSRRMIGARVIKGA